MACHLVYRYTPVVVVHRLKRSTAAGAFSSTTIFFLIIITQVILTYWRLIADVFKQNVEGLKQLDADITATFLIHDLEEKRQHVPLQEEAEKTRRNMKFCRGKNNAICVSEYLDLSLIYWLYIYIWFVALFEIESKSQGSLVWKLLPWV